MIRTGRWLRYPDIDGLPPGELQSDAILDLNPKGNTLSLWQVKGDDDERRVSVALAASRDRLDVFDYAVFEDAWLVAFGVIAEPSEADTPDPVVNSLHRGLSGLTVRQIVGLARAISVGRRQRIAPPAVKAQLVDAVRDGLLDRAKIKPGILDKL